MNDFSYYYRNKTTNHMITSKRYVMCYFEQNNVFSKKCDKGEIFNFHKYSLLLFNKNVCTPHIDRPDRQNTDIFQLFFKFAHISAT